MGKQILNGVVYGNQVPYRELTKAEYDALPNSKYNDGIMYYIRDVSSPDNFGTPHKYSTDEQIVGTWINGKILYEKTICYTSSAGQSDSDKIIDNTILHGVNCNVVDVQGTQSYGYMNDQMPNDTSDPEPLSQSSLYLPYYGGGNIAPAHIYFYSDGIHFIKRCAASEANSIILIVKYVKKSS